MEDAIEKFIDYLKEFVNELNKKKMLIYKFKARTVDNLSEEEIDYNLIAQNELIKFFECSNESKSEPYLSYNFLSSLLCESNLTNHEKIECLMFVIRKNNTIFNTGKNNVIFDLVSFSIKYGIDNLEPLRAEKLMRNIDFKRILFSSDTDLNKKELEIKKIMLEQLEETEKEQKDFIHLNRCIETHYINKLDCYTIKGIKIVDIALKHLNVNGKLRTIVIKTLTKNLPEPKKEIGNVPVKEENNSKLTYDAILQELREQIDLETMMPYKKLPMQEKIYYLFLMTKINIPKDKRRRFLSNCETFRFGENALSRYLDSLEKLKFYEEKAGLQNELQFLAECYSLIKEGDNLFVNTFESELKQVESWLPKNFLYEETEVERMLKK